MHAGDMRERRVCDMIFGDVVLVHFIVFMGPDEWIPARVVGLGSNGFEVQTVGKEFPGGYSLMWLRNDGSSEKPQQWRSP